MLVSRKMVHQHSGNSILVSKPVSLNDLYDVDPTNFKPYVSKQLLFNFDKNLVVLGLFPENIKSDSFFIPVLSVDYGHIHIPYEIKSHHNQGKSRIIFRNDCIMVEIPSANMEITKIHEFHHEDIVFANKYILGTYWITFLYEAGIEITDYRS